MGLLGLLHMATKSYLRTQVSATVLEMLALYVPLLMSLLIRVRSGLGVLKFLNMPRLVSVWIVPPGYLTTGPVRVCTRPGTSQVMLPHWHWVRQHLVSSTPCVQRLCYAARSPRTAGTLLLLMLPTWATPVDRMVRQVLRAVGPATVMLPRLAVGTRITLLPSGRGSPRRLRFCGG